MKKLFLTAIIALVMSVNGVSKAPADIAMGPIIEKSLDYISMLEDEKDQEIVHVEYDIIHTKKEVTRNLQKGYSYGIVAYADDRVAAVSLKAYRKNGTKWVLVDKDTEGDAVAVVEVNPNSNGEYKFVIEIDKYKRNYTAAHYGLILFHEAPSGK